MFFLKRIFEFLYVMGENIWKYFQHSYNKEHIQEVLKYYKITYCK